MAESNEQTISPWMPITDPHKLAALAKAIEESAELIGALARCVMAGFDEPDPHSGLPNIEELNKEYTDAKATMTYLKKFEPRIKAIPERQVGKINGFDRWHRMIDDKLAEERADKTAAASVEGHRGDGFPYS